MVSHSGRPCSTADSGGKMAGVWGWPQDRGPCALLPPQNKPWLPIRCLPCGSGLRMRWVWVLRRLPLWAWCQNTVHAALLGVHR